MALSSTSPFYAPTPAAEWQAFSRVTGIERPEVVADFSGPALLRRSFVFFDLCGSTSFLEQNGPGPTLAAISAFRDLVRQVSARRGVRIAKWLGDGCMIVAVEPGPAVATAVEVCARCADSPLAARAGVSVSNALLFEGDDYLAKGANFASRLCDRAAAGQVLADKDCFEHLPDWIVVLEQHQLEIAGMGQRLVHRLGFDDDVKFPDLAS